MIGLAINNLLKRKTRSILTILGILFIMLLYIVISGIMNTYEKDLQTQLASVAGKIIVQPKTENSAGSFYTLDVTIRESDAKGILALENINLQKSTMVFYQALVGTWKPNLPPTVMCTGIEPGKETAYFGDIDVKGSNSLKGAYDVILGSYAAMYFKSEQGADLGDIITMKDTQFTIVGILPDISSVINDSMIMPLNTAQDLFVRPGLISSVIVTTRSVEQTEGLAKLIESGYPKLMASTTKQLKKGVDEMLSELRGFMAMIRNTIIVVAIFIIMIVMVMAVNERKKEIGTLKAIGASGPRILGMVIVESLALSISGGILALPVSIPFEKAITSEVYTDVSMWIQTLVVTVVLGVVSSLWPAWSALRVNPLESLRYE